MTRRDEDRPLPGFASHLDDPVFDFPFGAVVVVGLLPIAVREFECHVAGCHDGGPAKPVCCELVVCEGTRSGPTYSTAPSSSTSRASPPSGPEAPEASVRNTALHRVQCARSRWISVSPGNTGLVNRASIEVTALALAIAKFGDQRSAGEPVGAQSMHDRLGEARQFLGEPRVAVQRIAVAGEPVDQRLILPSGQRDAGVRFPIRDFRGDRALTRLSPEAALAADHQRGQGFGDERPRVRIAAAGAQHDDRVLARALVLDYRPPRSPPTACPRPAAPRAAGCPANHAKAWPS